MIVISSICCDSVIDNCIVTAKFRCTKSRHICILVVLLKQKYKKRRGGWGGGCQVSLLGLYYTKAKPVAPFTHGSD